MNYGATLTEALDQAEQFSKGRSVPARLLGNESRVESGDPATGVIPSEHREPRDLSVLPVARHVYSAMSAE